LSEAGQPWWSPIACPECARRIKKDVWMTTVVIGGVAIKYECRVCNYTVPLAFTDRLGELAQPRGEGGA
jgi:hypothetical protein